MTALEQFAWMREQLARYSRRGWTMTIEPSGHDSQAVLVVRYTAEDSRNPEGQIALKARRAIGPYGGQVFDDERFAIDLKRALLHGVYEHELDETLYRDGALLNDPHADPTRWHCPCGGVGPPRREGRGWACPCGKESQ